MKNIKSNIIKAGIIALGLSPIVSYAQWTRNLITSPSTYYQISPTTSSDNAGIYGTNFLEFGVGYNVGGAKEQNAGKIGYATFDAVGTGALCIVGAGTGANRRIHFWNEGGAKFDGPISIGGYLSAGNNIYLGSEYFGLIFPTSYPSGSPPTGYAGGITGDDNQYKRLTLYHGYNIAFETNTNTQNVGYTRMLIDQNGNVGIGTGVALPQALLEVNTNAKIGNGGTKYNTALTLIKNGDGNGTDYPALILKHSGVGSNVFGSSSTDNGVIRIQGFNTSYQNKAINSMDNFMVYTNGQVQVGTKVPIPTDWKLAVSGKIYCTEINVTPYDGSNWTPWPDHVFKSDYKLSSLAEVEAHIKENGHLKDVPSAEEVAKSGYKVGEMDATLLRKIEELTLYLLDQNKKILAQQEINKILQKEVAELKASK